MNLRWSGASPVPPPPPPRLLAVQSFLDEKISSRVAPAGRPGGLHGGPGRIEVGISGQLGVRGQVRPAPQQIHHRRHCARQGAGSMRQLRQQQGVTNLRAPPKSRPDRDIRNDSRKIVWQDVCNNN